MHTVTKSNYLEVNSFFFINAYAKGVLLYSFEDGTEQTSRANTVVTLGNRTT